MKYGIILNGRVTEPVTIPEPLPSWAPDAAKFLEVMFPGKTGWVGVKDDAQPGTVINPDGTYPPEPERPKVPMVFDSADWKEYAYGVLGTLAAPTGTNDEKALAGLIRYGQIMQATRASQDAGVVAALDQYDDATNFRQDKVGLFLKMLNLASIVSDNEFAAIIGYWPKQSI